MLKQETQNPCKNLSVVAETSGNIKLTYVSALKPDTTDDILEELPKFLLKHQVREIENLH